MNEGIHLDLDTWIVPGQIRKANLCRGLGNRYTPAGRGIYTLNPKNPGVGKGAEGLGAAGAAKKGGASNVRERVTTFGVGGGHMDRHV